MLKIGLTGGIGSGKSTVANLFSQQGIETIDADNVARLIVRPGETALEQIRQQFGNDIIAEDGQLDRLKMRHIIFGDVQKREHLESILHPLIKQHILEWTNNIQSNYCIIVVPLLIEQQWTEMVDRVLVVDCPATLQMKRVQQRDSSTKRHVMDILNSQIDRDTRLQYADDILYNDKSRSSLQKQVEKLHKTYLNLSNQTSH